MVLKSIVTNTIEYHEYVMSFNKL